MESKGCGRRNMIQPLNMTPWKQRKYGKSPPKDSSAVSAAPMTAQESPSTCAMETWISTMC